MSYMHEFLNAMLEPVGTGNIKQEYSFVRPTKKAITRPISFFLALIIAGICVGAIYVLIEGVPDAESFLIGVETFLEQAEY